MPFEDLARGARNKTQEVLDELAMEAAARKKMEELDEKVSAGEWDPEEFASTEFQSEDTKEARPKKKRN